MSRTPTVLSRREVLKAFGAAGAVGSVVGVTGREVTAQTNTTTWPMFGKDPTNTAYAPDAVAPTANVEPQWQVETGDGIPSSPAIADGTVYFGSGDSSVYALSVADGSEQWTTPTDSPITSSPAVVDGTVYVGSQDTYVYAMDAADGTVQWSHETGGGVFSSPTVVDGTVFVGSRDNTIYALSAADGTERWTYETNGEVWSSPAVVDGTVFVGSRDNNVYALSSADGSEQWVYQTGDWVESPPAVSDGRVYVGSLDKTVYALSATDGSEYWTAEMSDVIASSPAVTDGTIYVGSRDGKLSALAKDDGTQQWEYETEDRVFSSPTVTSDAVYFGSADNTVYAVSTTDGSELWTFDTQGVVFSSPAITNGTVFIGSNDASLYAITSPDARAVAGAGSESTTTTESTVSSVNVTGEGLFDNGGLVPFLIGAIGISGGGIWLAQRRLSSDDDDSAEDSGATSVKSTQPATERTKGSTDEPNKESEHQSASTPDALATDAQTPTLADRMVPDRIPTTPDAEVNYTALTNEEQIGSGGNADVTRATVKTGNDELPIAIKEPRLSGTIHADAIDRILTEAETWKELDDHDHIVDVLDYGSEPLPWIAMEYMDGGDLSERIDDVTTEQAIWTALVVTQGVHHAHRQGIAHLDLKPENILFRNVEDGWDVPKVSDWGLAKELLDHSKSVEGLSPQYAAPEQFSEEYGHADDITDVYQLGTVFYELFTGHPPFEGPPAKVMHSVLQDMPDPPSEVADVPTELDDILLTALEKSKEDRYDSLVYLRDALQELYDGEVDIPKSSAHD